MTPRTWHLAWLLIFFGFANALADKRRGIPP